MAILMQHAWHIRVTQKSAAHDQRFIVSGATDGNGIHPGVVGSEAWVRGSRWSIVIQSKTGGVWVNSTEKLQLAPSPCGGFNILSDDYGPAPDFDFNDLVLRCTPVATSGATDYFIYGHVSYYEGCTFNPCWRNWLVIDTHQALQEALSYPGLKDYIQKVYPDKTIERPLPPPPPDSSLPLFKPLMLPLQGNDLLPQKEATLFRLDKTVEKAKAKEDIVTETYSPVSSVSLKRSQFATSIVADRPGIAGILTKYRFCNVENYQSALLRFVEYDRTDAELAGGPYTGTGTREILGTVITDDFGNYIFRFQRTDFQDSHELEMDVKPGESFSLQMKPDILVQVLDPTNVSRVLFETGLYANVSPCKRVNLCVPKHLLGTTVNPCVGEGLIQYVGNTFVGANAAGERGGNGYVLHNSGRISGNGLSCAAWRGVLKLVSCRLTHPGIAYYTVRYRYPGIPWTIVNEDIQLLKVVGGTYVNTSIRTTQELHVDGGAAAPTRCYLNVEASTTETWITSINYKAFLTTGNYTPVSGRGRVEFRLEGYRPDGVKIDSIDETIALYLDNHYTGVGLDPNVTMAGTTLGNCALFSLPMDGGRIIENAPLEIRFKANQESGFMGGYELTIAKGAIGNIGLLKTGNYSSSGWNSLPNTTPFPEGGTMVGRIYSFSSVSSFAACPVFRGTIDEIGADADGEYIRIKVQPVSSWLDVGQNFCAFRLRIDGFTRHTDGGTYSNYPFQSNEVLIGIERPV